MKLKKFTGLLLCAALALSMAACKFTTPAVVMTVEGEDIPAGLYLMYQYQAYSSAKSKLEDKSAKVLKSEIEGVKAEEWIHNETVASAKRYVWVEKAFAEAGLTFTEEEQASIDSQLDTIWANNEALLAANGIGRKTTAASMNAKRSMKSCWLSIRTANRTRSPTPRPKSTWTRPIPAFRRWCCQLRMRIPPRCLTKSWKS